MIFLLVLLLAVAVLAPLFRRRLHVERAHWAKYLADQEVYGIVSGSVLVRNIAGYDVYSSDVVPEGTVVIMDAHTMMAPLTLPTYEQTWTSGSVEAFRHDWNHWLVAYPELMVRVSNPKSVFIMNNVT